MRFAVIQTAHAVSALCILVASSSTLERDQSEPCGDSCQQNVPPAIKQSYCENCAPPWYHAATKQKAPVKRLPTSGSLSARIDKMRPCSECVQQIGRISKNGSISECICAQPQQQLQLEHHSPTEHEKHRSNIKPIEERCATMCNPSCQTQCQSLVIQQTHISSTVSLSLKCATICDNLCSAICSPNTAHFSVLISHLKQSLLDSIKQKLMAVISDAQREITPQRLILNRRTLHPDEKEELRELTECISECNDKCIDRCNGLLSALINRCQPQCLERCERVCAVNGTESAKPRDTHSRNQQGNTIRAQENKPLKSTTVSMIFTTTLPTTTTTPTTTPSTTSITAASKPTTSKPRSTNCNYECRQSNCEETLECSNSNQQYETSTEFIKIEIEPSIAQSNGCIPECTSVCSDKCSESISTDKCEPICATLCATNCAQYQKQQQQRQTSLSACQKLFGNECSCHQGYRRCANGILPICCRK